MGKPIKPEELDPDGQVEGDRRFDWLGLDLGL